MSPRSLAEHGVTWDEDGAPIGFQVGRAAAIQEWRWRKEQDARGFKGLCDRLWQRRYRERLSPERKEQAKARRAELYKVRREAIRAREAERLRKRRADPAYRAAQLANDRASYRARRAAYWASVVYVCEFCGKVWGPCEDKRPTGRRPRYCSSSHRERHARIKAKTKECAP